VDRPLWVPTPFSPIKDPEGIGFILALAFRRRIAKVAVAPEAGEPRPTRMP
jgi:hypothetical protein